MSFRVVTFNAGLAVGLLPYATERLPHVVHAIASLDADLVFVQEVWLDTHWASLLEAAKDPFPFAFRPAPAAPAVHGACTEEEVAPLVACAKAHCDGLTSEALASCVVRECAHAAMHMSPACVSCIARHPEGTLDEIVAPCIGENGSAAVRDEAARERRRGRWVPEGLVAYGGSYGTGLLSKRALVDPEVLPFEATLNARCAIHARILDVEGRDLHVFATHLSPGIQPEQQHQVDALVAWIDRTTTASDRVVLLGDLNTEPGSRLYAAFERAGFTNPYAEGKAEGTFSSGALTSGRHGTSGWLLDHVLVRGPSLRAHARRILDGPLVVESAAGPVPTTYSDHCGILAVLDSA